MLPEFPDLAFREVIVPPYRFFYRVRDDAVWVVAAWHSAQLPGEPEDVGRDQQADQADSQKRRHPHGRPRARSLSAVRWADTGVHGRVQQAIPQRQASGLGRMLRCIQMRRIVISNAAAGYSLLVGGWESTCSHRHFALHLSLAFEGELGSVPRTSTWSQPTPLSSARTSDTRYSHRRPARARY